MENEQPNLPILKASLTCNFKAVRAGQLNVEEGEEVTILSVQRGYATCQATSRSKKVGQIPAYFLEMVECPGHTFADQIRYRRMWHTMVDGEKATTSTDLHYLSAVNNADVFIRELGQVPSLAGFAQVLPNLGPLDLEMASPVDQKHHFRHLLFNVYNKGKKAAAAARDICNVYGEDSILERTARYWNGKFKNGNFGLQNTPFSGRPSNLDEDQLRAFLEEDERQTQRDWSRR